MKTIQDVLAENLSNALKRDPRSRDELARLSGVGKSTIEGALYKKTWPGIETIRALCDVLDIDERTLFFDPDLIPKDPGLTIFDGAKLLLAFEMAPLQDRHAVEERLKLDEISLQETLNLLAQQHEPTGLKES